jgi:hypothetical protein
MDGTAIGAVDTYVDVAAIGRNVLSFPDFCADGSSPAARVTSDDTSSLAPHRCPLPPDGGCALTWQIASGTAARAAGPTFSMELEGRATDCHGLAATMTFHFTSTRQGASVAALPHAVQDAAYSTALDRLVLTDAVTQALYVYDPTTSTEIAVPLPYAPRSLSVAPDGLRALVGHDGWITTIDLGAGRVEQSIPVTANARGCALGKGWAYVFDDGPYGAIHSVDLATHVEPRETRPDPWNGVVGLDGDALYGVSIATSLPYLERYDVSHGTPSGWVLGHSSHWAGDDVWLDPIGARVFTSNGSAFKISSDPGVDLGDAGALSGLTTVKQLDASASEVAAIPALDDTTLELFSSDQLERTGRLLLPLWRVGEEDAYSTHALAVFHGAGGALRHVVVQADAAAPLPHGVAVLTFRDDLLLAPPAGDHGPPIASIAPPPGAQPGVALALDGSASADPDGRALTYAWTVVRRPDGASPVLTGAATSGATFTPDREGAYTVQLTVAADDGQSATAVSRITVSSGALPALAHAVADAAYSRALDRIVMTDTATHALYVYDPSTGEEAHVDLPASPTCLGMAQDGLSAVVGHGLSVSWIDLTGPTLVKTVPVTASGACVLASNGYAHVFPSSDQWVAVHSVELATGVETLSAPSSLYAGARARLDASGSHVYTLVSSLSPPPLQRWDVSSGTATLEWTSADWGDHPTGVDLWPSPDGARIYFAAGDWFTAAATQDQDLVFGGILSGVKGATHVDASATEVAAIPAQSYPDPTTTDKDVTVELLDPIALGHVGRITLPRWNVNGTTQPTHGRFVFHSSDGSRLFVVVDVPGTPGPATAVLTY